MIVNDRFLFVFVHIPKTAGTSVRAALGGLDGNTIFGVGDTKHETPGEFLRNYENRTGQSSHRFEGYRFLCFVRHPVDRFASLHRYLINTHRHVYPQVPLSLNRFIEAVTEGDGWHSIRAIRPQYLYTEGVTPWIGRFESLQHDFQALAAMLEAPMHLDHKNSSLKVDSVSTFTLSPRKVLGRLKRARRSARYIPEDLSPESRIRLETYYAKDFEMFGY